jgi:hypothetical protein
MGWLLRTETFPGYFLQLVVKLKCLNIKEVLSITASFFNKKVARVYIMYYNNSFVFLRIFFCVLSRTLELDDKKNVSDPLTYFHTNEFLKILFF